MYKRRRERQNLLADFLLGNRDILRLVIDATHLGDTRKTDAQVSF